MDFQFCRSLFLYLWLIFPVFFIAIEPCIYLQNDRKISNILYEKKFKRSLLETTNNRYLFYNLQERFLSIIFFLAVLENMPSVCLLVLLPMATITTDTLLIHFTCYCCDSLTVPMDVFVHKVMYNEINIL